MIEEFWYLHSGEMIEIEIAVEFLDCNKQHQLVVTNQNV